MENFTDFIMVNALYAPWVMFGLLILAGFNLPISEDFMLIAGGALASTMSTRYTIHLFVWIFLGCYLSDCILYWLARALGDKLLKVIGFRRLKKHGYIDRIGKFYQKYGFLTLLIGRFIPFGMRNCLFITAGMVKMPFGQFVFSDGIACFVSNSVLFYIAYSFGKNYQMLLGYIRTYNIMIAVVFFAVVTIVSIMLWYKKRAKQVAQ